MRITEHIAALQAEGDRLASIAEAAAPDAPVGSCPGWQLRDLIRHVGSVHRWATGFVAEQRTDWVGLAEPDMLRAGPAADRLLAAWFREGHQRLVATLRNADPQVSCWTFLAAPSPLAFWARRQAHETAIHRADAELAAGAGPADVAPFPPGLAIDGIDELIMGFARRASKRRLRADPPCWLAVHAPGAPGALADGAGTPDTHGADAPDGPDARDGSDGHQATDWLIRMGTGSAEVARGPVPAGGPPEGHGCQFAGPPGALYLSLWNRAGADGLVQRGDPRALGVWRQEVTVRWS